jgi:triosephosphate isomerase
MRKKLIAGNWKMHVTPTEGRALIAELRADLDRDAARLARDREILVVPPFLTIPAVAQSLAGSSILLGAQNAHFEDKGAYTGEVAPAMLQAFGVTHVILGHSERRHTFGESDALVGKRVEGAIANRFTVILCVGETLDEHESGHTVNVVMRQLQAGLAGVKPDSAERVVVAYEPVWAIGTGRTASPEQAQTVQGAIREALADHFTRETADGIRILYGGSVTPENVDSLLAKPDIDGALVGGASLKSASFVAIARSGVAN